MVFLTTTTREWLLRRRQCPEEELQLQLNLDGHNGGSAAIDDIDDDGDDRRRRREFFPPRGGIVPLHRRINKKEIGWLLLLLLLLLLLELAVDAMATTAQQQPSSSSSWLFVAAFAPTPPPLSVMQRRRRHHLFVPSGTGGGGAVPCGVGGVKALQMCICIDCQWVTSCTSYHFVEEQHEQPHMTNNPTFTPQNGSPRIKISIRTERNAVNETETARMWKDQRAMEEKQQQQEQEQQLQQQEQQAGGQNGGDVGADADSAQDSTSTSSSSSYSVSSASYDLLSAAMPVVTYEYDVIACASFVQDEGCWVRNMPEEIRAANPNFVPT